MKKILLILGLIILIVFVAGGLYFWNFYKSFTKVEIIAYDPQLTIYLGCGNSIVLTSEDGSSALVVDTKMRGASELLRNQVKSENITIVNTHDHFDHVGGNALYPQAKIIAGDYDRKQWDEDSNKLSRYPDVTLKPGEEKILKIGTETVHIFNTGRAHTLNDTVVYLENRKLLVTGDLIFSHWHPALITKSGTRVASWIDTLAALSKKYEVQTLVPGHGPVGNKKTLDEMREYFILMSDAVGKKEKQAALKEKYRDYFAFPGMFSIGNTIKFIAQEKEAGKQ